MVISRAAGLLDALAGRVAADTALSDVRRRQLRWVLGELRRALGSPEMTPHLHDGRSFLTGEGAAVYLRLAQAGLLRDRPSRSVSSTAASARVRRQCLAQLCAYVGVDVAAAALPGAPPPARGTMTQAQHRWLLAHLQSSVGSGAAASRLWAVAALVTDTAARTGELARMSLGDVDLDAGTVHLVRAPQGRSVSAAVEQDLMLTPMSRQALDRWLTHREQLTSSLEGTVSALWVSVRGNHAGPRKMPPGMPLHAWGLSYAYRRTIEQLNLEHAGQPGWEPLPTRLDQLRRTAAAGHSLAL